MSEKQTTFFTVNCAGKLEFPNQCYKLCVDILDKQNGHMEPKETDWT
jgi:hypothetical protein